MENLGRGLVAIHQAAGKVFLSWRVLGTDPEDLAFDLYRSGGSGAPLKLNSFPITNRSCFLDLAVPLEEPTSYFVRPRFQGREQPASTVFRLPAHPPARNYLSIPLQTPPDYTPNDASVGDLDGDGEYEIVLHQSGRGRDNSQAGLTLPPVFQAYKLDGTLLWTINLGRNIREGAHYTQFMVYDLDGDGRAELVCKTADGTIDGVGHALGDPNADFRVKEGRATGKILAGPEYLTVFEGRTGRALASTNYLPARGNPSDWGDDYGNRVDRFLACIAYVDGTRPSVVMCRGYYTRTVLAAWDWRDAKLTLRWLFDSDQFGPADATNPYRGQGDHCLSVGDVDGDSKDEIIYGAMAVDHDGRPLYSTRFGHGDALHLSDLDPDRPGLEVLTIHERPRHPYGAELHEAATGKLIWGKPGGTGRAPDVGRGLAMDLDPRHRGCEMWAAGLPGLWNVKGETISQRKPRSCNFAVWWDGDLLRELLDRNSIAKWNWETETETVLLTAEGCVANNSSKSNPCLCADLLGDWREEVIWRTADNQELRVYTTTVPTEHRLHTLMHDPQYRLSVAWQNVSYNQPTHPGFYLGAGMSPPPRPNITLVPAPPRSP